MKAIASGLLFCCLIFPITSFGQDDGSQDTPQITPDALPKVDPTVNPPANTNPGAAAVPPNPNTAPANPAPATGYVFPTDKEIARYGFRGVSKIRALYGSMFTASWNTWVSRSPEEWGSGRGWPRRFGTSVISRGINQSTLVLLSIATKRDPLYYKCPCTGKVPRSVHAIKMTFMSRNRQGDASFSIPDVISPFVGPIVTRTTIYPSRYDHWDGVRAGGLNLLSNAGWNLIREFFLKEKPW